jgi:hypothetical protein
MIMMYVQHRQRGSEGLLELAAGVEKALQTVEGGLVVQGLWMLLLHY